MLHFALMVILSVALASQATLMHILLLCGPVVAFRLLSDPHQGEGNVKSEEGVIG
jgi:hypothetical protein